MEFRKDMKIALSYLEKYKLLTLMSILVLILIFLFEGLGIGMIIPIMQEISGRGSANFFTKYTRLLFDSMHIQYNFLNLMIVFGIAMLTKYLLLAVQSKFARVLNASIIYDLRQRAFQNLLDFPLSYYYKTKLGNLVASLYTSARNAGSLIEYTILMFTESIFCLVYLLLSLLISVPLTIFICGIASLAYLFIVPRFKIARDIGREEKDIMDKMSSFLFDKLGGIKVLKSFNNEGFVYREFTALARSYKEFIVKIQNNRIIADLLLEPPVLILIIVLLVVSVEVLHLSIIPLIALLYIFRSLTPRINTINKYYLQIQGYLPHFAKIQEIVEREDKIYLPEGSKAIATIKSGIEFSNVWFRYPGCDTYALKNINIFIEKNKTTALVGITGGGKTTLVDLILRHHIPEKGAIKIDGIDLSQIKGGAWRNIVSVVDQDNYLFNDSIYNNILYGKLDASEEEVINAAKLANAHNFILSIPQGYKAQVGERGIKLSGGQKQRIALARALIRNPQILILDEATSALDSDTERLIQDSIATLSQSKTIIIIAHRISTIIGADKIIVIEHGEAVEEGTHKELLGKSGVYEKYYRLQYQ